MTTSASALNIEEGTVLAIPLSEGEWALGQVIRPGVNFYVGVALEKLHEPLRKEQIEGKPLEIFSWTNDAEVYNGSWKNLGRSPLQDYGELPNYKLGIGDEARVETFEGKLLRKYDPERDGDLCYRTVRSPLLFQRLVRAAFGIGDWKESYDSAKR